MKAYDRLFVLWGDTIDGTRHIVGELWREGSSSYAFAYQGDLFRAQARGFVLMTEFPEVLTKENPYRAPRLFPTFAQRIPSRKRPDFGALLASWGVQNPDDPLEILARSGGVQLTDRIELAEFRPETDDLSVPLLFRVAGMKHQDDTGAERLRSGEPVDLVREPENQLDRCALVVVHGEHQIGRVPRQYSPIFARLLDAGRKIKTVADRRLILPTESGRWVVRAQAVGH